MFFSKGRWTIVYESYKKVLEECFIGLEQRYHFSRPSGWIQYVATERSASLLLSLLLPQKAKVHLCNSIDSYFINDLKLWLFNIQSKTIFPVFHPLKIKFTLLAVKKLETFLKCHRVLFSWQIKPSCTPYSYTFQSLLLPSLFSLYFLKTRHHPTWERTFAKSNSKSMV